ncbi:S-methyl-5'-thioadenosine phosphorylase [Dehalobacter sp. DCM]|uniref:S-methyl-5'-thioadenosine phosphorylase n=1 Tax=Dehalobacter sp. DCM TaxID=2907827 RepID=UPI00308160FF|nr:S-methyl-5'-thioadenosine phosphorylase [Dehalobacter sp. DCM]
MNYALIGGTGVEKLVLKKTKQHRVDTPYGNVSLDIGEIGMSEVVFLKRHGTGHTYPPHRINYRANIWALKTMGVKKILATGAVGSIVDELTIGDIVLVDQFLDFTKNRPLTFYEGGDRGVLHIDVTEPYCPVLRNNITEGAVRAGIKVKNGGVYVCTEGPRFETPAEIKMFRLLGGHLVGMTGVPEVVLARELGMCYATIALVTNQAAGINHEPLTHAEVIASMNLLSNTVAALVESTCKLMDLDQRCYCATGNKETGLF